MKSFVMVLTVIICLFSSTTFIQAQNADQVSGSEPIVVPENIRLLVEQITIAENNDNWDEYARLREEIIQAWQIVNPEVAKLYSSSNSGKSDISADGMPVNNDRLFNNIIPEEEYEKPLESPEWANDVMITSGKAYDISMDVNRNGDIYIAVNGRKDGSSTKDTVYVYKSTDSGVTWSEWGKIFASTLRFEQIELMCFDRTGGTEAYILLFYLFDNGWLRVGRRDMNTPTTWSWHTIVSEGVIDFAVDRNYSSSNYRAICMYDSSNRIYSKRSEPTSYGTVWQDKSDLAIVGKDLDFAYGWNGAVYTTFNGFNSGNLYVYENTNYADPTSWGPQYIVAQGSADTTRHAEIIASRENTPNNKVIVVFEKKAGSTYDLFDATRDNNVWTPYNGWVVPNENKWPSMYVSKIGGSQNFRAVFEQSGEGNATPRLIKYKGYDGSIWSPSLQFSDGDVTGLQKPEVGDIDGNTPISAFVGANWNGVYFDNESWAPPAPVINVNPTALDFGNVTVNTSSMLTFNIQNTGTADLIVTNITSSEPVFTVNLTSTTITPGNNQDVEVTFSPLLEQIYNGTISITHNAAGSPSSVTVTGVGDPASGVEDDFNNIPDDYALLQNYPNPFNPSTTIYYALPEASSVELIIYDVLGNEIMKYIENDQAAGYHKINFDASGFISGVYFYQLQAGNFIETKKMILMK